MKRFRKILWGIILVAIGVILGLNAMEITKIDLFFKGWWTMLLIVPGLIGLITERDKKGNLLVVAIGVCLFLGSRDEIGYELMWKLLVGIAIAFAGLSLIFRGLFKKKVSKKKRAGEERDGVESHSLCFTSQRLDFNGREFKGAKVNGVFCDVEVDLRFAIFTRDVELCVNSTFGNVRVLIPANLSVKVNTNSIFGDVTDESAGTDQMFPITLTLTGNCVFGDIEVK